jgi:hypothetical protein
MRKKVPATPHHPKVTEKELKKADRPLSDFIVTDEKLPPATQLFPPRRKRLSKKETKALREL